MNAAAGKKNNFFSFLLSAAAAACLLAGCAAPGAGLRKFSYPTTIFHERPYFVLRAMCEKEGVAWDYDPLSQVIILKKADRPGLSARTGEVKLMVSSATALVGDEVKVLSGPVEIKDSVIYAPKEVWEFFEPAVCKIPPPAAGTALRQVNLIVLDAGHGGRDPGAIGAAGLREKAVALDVAEKISKGLQACGLNTLMTRASDIFVPLADRAHFANEKKADLFVSIHANANHSRWIDGFEVYYLTEAVDDDARALAAAENTPPEIEGRDLKDALMSLKAMLWDMIYTENRRESIELATAIGRRVSKKMGLKLLGVKGAPFAVLKGTRMPAVLVEIGYLSNREGERHLRDDAYRHKMAEAIAEGIMEFRRRAEGER